jgi:hypothetical protein
VYTEKSCLDLLEASEVSIQLTESKTPIKTNKYNYYEERDVQALIIVEATIVVKINEKSPNEYSSYRSSEEVNKLLEAELKKDEKSNFKTVWRDSEVWKLEETYALLNNSYDPRSFQRVPYANKKEASKKQSNPKQPEKKRLTRQEILKAASKE